MVKEKPNSTRTYDEDGFRRRAACLCVKDASEQEVGWPVVFILVYTDRRARKPNIRHVLAVFFAVAFLLATYSSHIHIIELVCCEIWTNSVR